MQGIWGKMKQVFCTIHIVCLTLKEIIAQAIAHQFKKIHAPENCPTPLPLQKIMVRLLADSNHIQD